MPSNTTPEQRAGKLETFAGFCQDRRETAPGSEQLPPNNKIFLLIEEKAMAAGNKVSTLNSDIFSRMATPSTETFQRHKFHQLHPNILDSEVILAPFNHGRHWCLVLVNLKEKMSVYIDSLHDGAGAKMAFTRLNNFLTCSASLKGQTWNRTTGDILQFLPLIFTADQQ